MPGPVTQNPLLRIFHHSDDTTALQIAALPSVPEGVFSHSLEIGFRKTSKTNVDRSDRIRTYDLSVPNRAL